MGEFFYFAFLGLAFGKIVFCFSFGIIIHNFRGARRYPTAD